MLRTAEGRAFLQRLRLPDDARERIKIALAMGDALETQLAPLERELRAGWPAARPADGP